MFKNKIKVWGLRKYLKEDEALQIIEGEAANGMLPPGGEAEDIKERAERALKRKRARKRAHTQPSPLAHTASPVQLPTSPISQAVVPFAPPQRALAVPSPDPVRIT